MKTTSEYVRLLHEYFENSARNYGVKRMALFGSVAREEQQGNSDVDVLYEGQANLFLRTGTTFEEELFKDAIYV